MDFTGDLHHRPDLLATGVSDAEVRSAIERGHLTRLARGVYVREDVLAGLRPEDRYALRARAQGVRSPGLVVSHAAAAAVHGLPLVEADLQRVHLTRPGRGGSSVGPERVVHAGRLDPGDLVDVDGLAVTSVPRTLLDLARRAPMATAVAATDAALQRELATPAELEAALAGTSNSLGLPAVRRAWSRVDGRAESPGESLARLAMAETGLPSPQLQVRIEDDDGVFVGRVDLAFLAAGLLIEFDGEVKYGRLLRPGQSLSEIIVAEKRREERLTELGWLVIRLVWADLWHPDRLARRLTSAARARRPLVPGIRGRAVPAEPVTVTVRR